MIAIVFGVASLPIIARMVENSRHMKREEAYFRRVEQAIARERGLARSVEAEA